MSHLSMRPWVIAGIPTASPVAGEFTDYLSYSDLSPHISSGFFSGIVNDDSTKLFLPNSIPEINEFDFGVAGDITTLTYNRTVSIPIPSPGNWQNFGQLTTNSTFDRLYGHAKDTSLNYSGDAFFILEWELSVAGDISTISYNDNYFSLDSEWDSDNQPRAGIQLGRDEDQYIFITDRTSSDTKIYRYDMSTPSDITTMSYSGNSASLAPFVMSTNNFSMGKNRFYSNGVANGNSKSIKSWYFKYPDISTVVYDGDANALDVSGADDPSDGNPDGVIFDPNYKQLYWAAFERYHGYGIP